MLEKDVERKVGDYAKARGFIVFKFSSPSRASVPDRIFISPFGDVFFIEFKAPGKKATPAQQRELDRINKQGACAWCCDDVDFGKRIIEQYLWHA